MNVHIRVTLNHVIPKTDVHIENTIFDGNKESLFFFVYDVIIYLQPLIRNSFNSIFFKLALFLNFFFFFFLFFLISLHLTK